MSQVLVIQPIHPLPYSSINLPDDGELAVIVHITLGCGCPTCAGGPWDASFFRVKARLSNNGMHEETSLAYSGRVSEFTGTAPIRQTGSHMLEFTAMDPETGLAGRVMVNFKIIRPPEQARKYSACIL